MTHGGRSNFLLLEDGAEATSVDDFKSPRCGHQRFRELIGQDAPKFCWAFSTPQKIKDENFPDVRFFRVGNLTGDSCREGIQFGLLGTRRCEPRGNRCPTRSRMRIALEERRPASVGSTNSFPRAEIGLGTIEASYPYYILGIFGRVTP